MPTTFCRAPGARPSTRARTPRPTAPRLAQAFLDVLAAYQSAPVVTAWRLYLEAVDEVLKKSSRVLVDSSGSGLSAVTPYMSLGEARTVPRSGSNVPLSAFDTQSPAPAPTPFRPPQR